MDSQDHALVALLDRARHGCPASARELHDRYERCVRATARRHLRRCLRPRLDPDDVAQDVWLRFFHSVLPRRPFDGPGHLGTFLAGMARNAARKLLRDHARRARDPRRERHLGEALPDRGPVLAVRPVQEEAIAIEDEWDRLLDDQGADVRRVLLLLREGCILKEAAVLVGVSEKTVRRTVRPAARCTG